MTKETPTADQHLPTLVSPRTAPPPATAAPSPGASRAKAKPPSAAALPNPFDTFDRAVHPAAGAASDAVREWTYAAARGLGRGLVLWSEPHTGPGGETFGYGCGKTHLARAAFTYLRQCVWTDPDTGLSRRWRVTFLNIVDFYAQLRDLYAKGQPEFPLFNDWASGHVILDDLGKEHVTTDSRPWAREKFYRLIDRIYESRALLLTSNLTPEQIETHLGGAAWSRLVGLCGERGFVNMSALPDYRLRRAGL